MTSRNARAAERCGRRAAQLLDDHDTLLIVPSDGRALAALCAATPAGVTLRGSGDAAILARLGARVSEDGDTTTIVIIEAIAAYDDGSCALPSAATPVIARARAHAIPCYVLAPAGPQPRADTLQPTPAAQIAAILTARGTYRPTMIVRHNTDPDIPLDDVIPLS